MGYRVVEFNGFLSMFLNATQMVNTYQPGYLTNGFSQYSYFNTFFNQTPIIIYDGNIHPLR